METVRLESGKEDGKTQYSKKPNIGFMGPLCPFTWEFHCTGKAVCSFGAPCGVSPEARPSSSPFAWKSYIFGAVSFFGEKKAVSPAAFNRDPYVEADSYLSWADIKRNRKSTTVVENLVFRENKIDFHICEIKKRPAHGEQGVFRVYYFTAELCKTTCR